MKDKDLLFHGLIPSNVLFVCFVCFLFYQVPARDTVCTCVYLQYHNDDIICSAVVDCGLLPNITNGMVIYNTQGQDQTLLGATVTYSCNTGYTLSENSMRTCQADGTWSGNNPTCNSECMYEPFGSSSLLYIKTEVKILMFLVYKPWGGRR